MKVRHSPATVSGYESFFEPLSAKGGREGKASRYEAAKSGNLIGSIPEAGINYESSLLDVIRLTLRGRSSMGM